MFAYLLDTVQAGILYASSRGLMIRARFLFSTEAQIVHAIAC